MPVDAAIAIRAGSGLLLVLLGAAALFPARGDARATMLALLPLAFGSAFVASNAALAFDLGVAALWALGIATTFGAFVLVLLLLRYPRPLSRRDAAPLAAALALALVAAVPSLLSGSHRFYLALGGAEEFPAFAVAATTLASFLRSLLGYAVVLGLVFRVATWRDATRRELTHVAAVVLLVGAYLTFAYPASGGGSTAGIVGSLALVGGAASGWLVIAARHGARFAIAVALAFSAMGLAGALYFAAGAQTGGIAVDPLGLYGVVRILGWIAFVYAILRLDLLGVPLPRLAVRRGTVAATALASFFIVAQLAEATLNARFGLLTGSVVAGAMLFAASPIQRAAERILTGEPSARQGPAGPREPSGFPAPTANAEAAYRKAVHLALVGGPLTAQKEVALAEVADELGLRASDATRLRHEVENRHREAR